jgi:hypothetical protein
MDRAAYTCNGQFLVAPIVLATAGVRVAAGASGADLVRPAVLAASAPAWEGKAIVLDHHEDDVLGRLGDAAYTRNGLESLGLFDPFLLRLKCPWLLRDLLLGVPTPVSISFVGYYDRNAPGPVSNGRRVREYTRVDPDHVAVLSPGCRGSCDLSDGAGLFVSNYVPQRRHNR